ncbi:homoserine kinase [Reichenbachiella carrageenanivorans]|uniref:Homoserine kinase n=1 Tax=Reichenbachiella carrageenanivorans TaxID=2979869 RepID=A0ABY6CZ80_9BACT|nr:homoserine kinase [Reichenbachiella carrageenanivorans]UXX79229.1 homoserine kinase [Reichenbachiella carrageenanivorans]
MPDKIKIFSPSTVANVGCGYDVLGFALDGIGEEMTVSKRDDGQLVIEEIIGFDLPKDPAVNTATVAAQALLDAVGSKQGFSFIIKKTINPGSGMGTSSSSSAGGVFAVNELLGRPYTSAQLVEFAMEGEKAVSKKAHADNVAPNLLGGFTLVRSYEPLDVLSLPVPEDLYVTIVHPQVEVKTTDAKKILKKQVDLSMAVKQWGNVGGLVAGLYESNYDLIGRSMVDVIVEPIRKILIPLYDDVKAQALADGALGCSIAGSGPSIFAFSKGEETALKIKSMMQEKYDEVGILAYTYMSKIGEKGVRTI